MGNLQNEIAVTEHRDDLNVKAKRVIVYGVDGTTAYAVKVNPDGSLNIGGTVPLPTGAATEAKQDDQITQETIIAGDTTSIDSKITACDTTNKATDTLQTTGNAILTTIDGDTGSILTTQTDKTQMTQITNGTNEADILQNADDDSTPEDLYGVVTSSVLYGRTGSSDIRPLRIDSSTNTLQTIGYEHHEIHSGSNYRVQANDPAIGNGGEVSISFYVPTGTTLPHIVWETSHSGSMTMQLLEGTTLTLGTGTDVLCKNSRRDAGDTSMLQGVSTGSLASYYVTKNATYSGGTVISDKRDYSTKNTAGGQLRRQELVLADDTYYTFVLSNDETTAQGGQIRLEWYEHADKT